MRSVHQSKFIRRAAALLRAAPRRLKGKGCLISRIIALQDSPVMRIQHSTRFNRPLRGHRDERCIILLASFSAAFCFESSVRQRNKFKLNRESLFIFFIDQLNLREKQRLVKFNRF